jgi:heat shock protein HslJ
MEKNLRSILFISLFLGGLLLSACASGSNSLDATNWEMTSYRDANGDMQDILANSVVTAQFQSTNVSGIAGCNNYNGSYQLDGNKLTFGALAVTQKACADPRGVMEQENAYLAALSQVQSFKQSNDKLEMEDERGKTVLEFVPSGQ